MKTQILLFLTLTVSSVSAQLPRGDDGRIEFKEIIQLDSAYKTIQFGKARMWVANAFKSAQNVVQYENPQEGKMLCKGTFDIKPTGQGMNGTIHRSQAGFVNFTLEITVKEDRCRIRAYELSHTADSSGGSLENEKPDCGTFLMTMKTWESIKGQSAERMTLLFTDFENAMKAKKTDDF